MTRTRTKRDTPESAAGTAVANTGLISDLIDGLSAKGTLKYRRAKELTQISATNPELLYPHFRFFVKLLDSPNNILKCNAIFILANLAKVDIQHRFDQAFDTYYRHLWDGSLITAANILGVSGKIAVARPDLQNRITWQMLRVEEIPLPTTECREIARGKVLLSLREYLVAPTDNQQVSEFIRLCLGSHRPATRKKAEALARYL